ncbi:hypothetical protein FEZ32_10030 [Acidipropionibacterium jensenii]|uniref:hypothetical protein n=1 Tax=Acidipropionibacterium jensenii TaxID=1749 RepID=UPI00110A1E9E|nr:hypothetical protein [Acidipropionibacterium jensenii]QCV88646.1 hypothetical protein FEZ32_10030 [Acidipropionibacterium jensenii]
MTTRTKRESPSIRPAVQWAAPIKSRHHSMRWRIVFVLVVCYILIIVVGLGEYLFGLVIALAATALLLSYRQKDEVVHDAELRDGIIHIRDRSYDLKDYKAFQRGPVSGIDMIMLVPRKWHALHYDYVNLSEAEAENKDLVKALKTYGLEKREYRDDLTDKLVRMMGI